MPAFASVEHLKGFGSIEQLLSKEFLGDKAFRTLDTSIQIAHAAFSRAVRELVLRQDGLTDDRAKEKAFVALMKSDDIDGQTIRLADQMVRSDHQVLYYLNAGLDHIGNPVIQYAGQFDISHDHDSAYLPSDYPPVEDLRSAGEITTEIPRSFSRIVGMFKGFSANSGRLSVVIAEPRILVGEHDHEALALSWEPEQAPEEVYARVFLPAGRPEPEFFIPQGQDQS